MPLGEGSRFATDPRVTFHTWTQTHLLEPTNPFEFCARHLCKSQWLGTLDTDEFVVLERHATLGEFLRPYEECAGVCLSLTHFGPSGVEQKGDASRVIPSYRYREPDTFWAGAWTKSFVQVACRPNFGGCVHAPSSYDSATNVGTVNTAFQPYEAFRRGEHPVLRDVASVNHYVTRSFEDWAAKCKRGYGFEGNARQPQRRHQDQIWYWEHHCTQYDDRILQRHWPELLAELPLLPAKKADSEWWQLYTRRYKLPPMNKQEAEAHFRRCPPPGAVWEVIWALNE